jgi:hypothetical protein
MIQETINAAKNVSDIKIPSHLLSYAEFQFGDRVLGKAYLVPTSIHGGSPNLVPTSIHGGSPNLVPTSIHGGPVNRYRY